MTIVYPLTVQNDYTELLFSLRSIEKYLKKPYEVLIIGEVLPEWIVNVTHINLPDVRGKKQLSIRRKILAGLQYVDEFLFMNDDVYFLKPVIEFSYYYHGQLKQYSETGSRQLEKRLIELNKPTKVFDGHYPLMYDQRFKEVSEQFHSDCIIKSMFCNFVEIEGELVSDCKLLRSMSKEEIYLFIKDKPCFSTGVMSIKSALPVLEELFPNKSKYEI